MALTPSSLMPLGTVAPAFELLNPATGEANSLDALKGEKGTLVIFMCNHCPYVKHIMDALSALGKDYQDKPVNIVAISANDPHTHPADAPEKMAELVKDKNLVFPYLFDESQEIAKAYGAECTPEFFVFDGDLKCVYRGQFDDSRPGNSVPPTGADVRAAMDALLDGGTISEEQTPSIGCNIKWRQ